MNLLPAPRVLQRRAGFYPLPSHGVLHFESELPRDQLLLPIASRVREAAAQAGVMLEPVTGPADHPKLVMRVFRDNSAPEGPNGYALDITGKGIILRFRRDGGLHFTPEQAK